MDASGAKTEEPKKRRRFNQEQYEMLLRCSKKKDMTEWNEWRKKKENSHKEAQKGKILEIATPLLRSGSQ